MPSIGFLGKGTKTNYWYIRASLLHPSIQVGSNSGCPREDFHQMTTIRISN